MIQKRILVIGTYPIEQPAHGGQKRTAAIVSAYKSRFTDVQFVAVFYRGFYSDYAKSDIPLSKASELKMMQSPLTGDIVCGEAIYQDPAVKNAMTAVLQTFKPDCIHIEQPFPYLGLKPLLHELNLAPKIIFGSQNIEAPMKRDILLGAGMAVNNIAPFEKVIHELETELSRVSDLVVACTPSDLKAHKRMGARNLVLASNGIARSVATVESRDYWNNIFESKGVRNKILFVGSAHPPNWTGFLDMVGKGLGFLKSNSRIVIGGSISDYFDRLIDSNSPDIQDATFWLRAHSAGRLSEERLVGLIDVADVMILPITEGGGSNLKTAEAILADKKVVATEHALRSFEWFRDFPNLWIANSQAKFQASITEALSTPFIERTAKQRKQASQVEWPNLLGELVKEVEKI